jgi:NAD+ synthase (glutamine-hydrolysing)
LSHLKDINHSPDDHNVTYENAQARERTQVLMDLANDTNSLMIGTGDLSELCLGWCTYNGDHMSMYGVNGSIPKTLVRYLCQGYALLHPEAAKPLNDIIDTPISPELLPTDQKGQIAQKTEDKIGPYELHDFFIYHFLRFGFRPKKALFFGPRSLSRKIRRCDDQEVVRRFLKTLFPE